MRLSLNLTLPNGQQHEADVPDITVEAIAVDISFEASNTVPDVDRYRLRLAGGRISLDCHTVRTVSPLSNDYYDVLPEDQRSTYTKTIVIVLESPHKEEYLHNDIFNPIAPAQGATGRNVQKYLHCVLHSWPGLCDELEQGTRIVLSNPVQIQASLASKISSSDWRKVRDVVWTAMWNDQSVRNDFESRLERYSPDFIINACTHNAGCNCQQCPENTECKKNKVRTFLEGRFGAPKYEVAHPSSWQCSPAHRRLYRYDTQ